MSNYIDWQTDRVDPGKHYIGDWSLLYNNLLTGIGGAGVYFADYTESNHAVAGSGRTIYAILDGLSADTDPVTVILPHNEGTTNTDYHFTGTRDLSAYTNAVFIVQAGARFDIATGATVTFPSPEHIKAGERQEIFNLTGTAKVTWDNPGDVHLGWFGATYDDVDEATAWAAAFNSSPERGIRIIHAGGISKLTTGISWPHNGVDEYYPISLVGKAGALRRTGTYTDIYSGMSVVNFDTTNDSLFDLSSAYTFSGEIRGLACYGKWDGGGVNGLNTFGINGNQFQTATIEKCRFVGFENGVYLSTYFYYGTFRDNVIAHNGINMFLDVCNCQGTIFQNSVFNRANRYDGTDGPGWGIRSTYPAVLHLLGCYIENNDNNGISVSDPEKVKLDGCYLEGNCDTTGNAHVVVNGSAFYDSSVTVDDCKFDWGDKGYDRYCLSLGDVSTLGVRGNVFKDYNTSNDQVITVSGTFPSGVAFGNKLPFASGVTLMPDPAKTGRFLNLDQQYKGIWTAFRFPLYVDNFQLGDIILCDGESDDESIMFRVTEPGAGTSVSALSITANINNGASTLTNMSSQDGLVRGMAVQVDDGGSPHVWGDGNDYCILVDFPSSTTATINTTATDTLTGEAVTHNAVAHEKVYFTTRTETITTTSGNISVWGETKFDTTGGAIARTLPDGVIIGQQKGITLETDGGTDVTLTVTNHATSDPEVFTFADAGDTLILQWDGTDWWTVRNVGVAT